MRGEIYRPFHSGGSGLATLILGFLSMLIFWCLTHPYPNDDYASWTTDVRVGFLGCVGAGSLWGTALWHADLHHMSRGGMPRSVKALFAAAYAILLFLTVTSITGLVRIQADREMPCLEYREDTCLECLSFDDVASGSHAPDYQCTDWAYEPCQICVARMARDPERKPYTGGSLKLKR